MEDIGLLRKEENIHQVINLTFKNLNNISCKFTVKLLCEENVRY